MKITDKLYGYYVGDNLIYISSDKNLLQEILVDDYFASAFFDYNLRSHSQNAHRYRVRPKDAIKFWQLEKEYPSLPEQHIVDLKKYLIF